MLVVGLLFLLSCVYDGWSQHLLLAPWALAALILPAVFLACRTASLAHRWPAFPQFCTLYFLYGLARAYAVSQQWTPARHRS